MQPGVQVCTLLGDMCMFPSGMGAVQDGCVSMKQYAPTLAGLRGFFLSCLFLPMQSYHFACTGSTCCWCCYGSVCMCTWTCVHEGCLDSCGGLEAAGDIFVEQSLHRSWWLDRVATGSDRLRRYSCCSWPLATAWPWVVCGCVLHTSCCGKTRFAA